MLKNADPRKNEPLVHKLAWTRQDQRDLHLLCAFPHERVAFWGEVPDLDQVEGGEVKLILALILAPFLLALEAFGEGVGVPSWMARGPIYFFFGWGLSDFLGILVGDS